MKKLQINSILKLCSITFRDYLLHPSFVAPTTINNIATKIGPKNGSSETPQKAPKKEKKVKKIPEMSESRIKKFQKLFAQKIPDDEKLVNYFSCALVSDILLQGHLYISGNYFSFYSNVFGYVTKLVIPIASVTFISKEKTVKMFPNAIGIQLIDAKHVFGSFLSRETAYQLMLSMTKKLSPIDDKIIGDEIDGECVKEDDEEEEVEVEEVQSSKDDSSSLSSENQIANEIIQPEPASPPQPQLSPPPSTPKIHQPTYSHHNYVEHKQPQQPQKILFIGIALTLILAFFTAFLLIRINSIENRTLYHRDFSKMSIDEAETVLNRNIITVRNVRRKLEELQSILENNFNDNSHDHEL